MSKHRTTAPRHFGMLRVHRRQTQWKLTLIFALATFAWSTAGKTDELPVAKLAEGTEVSFHKDILPVFRKKCLACHNASDKEASLILENVSSILKGGDSGPAIVPGKPAESLLFIVAKHADEPVMPPEDNDVGAGNLTPQELGKLARWIELGAKEDSGAASEVIQWQPLPPGIHPIYAMAMASDGRYLAAGRANQITVYHIPGKRVVAKLTDPALLRSGIYQQPGVAHLDLVQSVAFHPTGAIIASGGYRTVKLWQRPTRPVVAQTGAAGSPITSIVGPLTNNRFLIARENGSVALMPAGKTQAEREWKVDGSAKCAAYHEPSSLLAVALSNQSLRILQADGKSLVQVPLPAMPTALAWLGDRQLAAGCADGTIRLIGPTPPSVSAGDAKPESGDTKEASDTSETPAAWGVLVELTGIKSPISGLAVLDGQPPQLLAAAEDGQIRLWDVAGKKIVRVFNHGKPVTSIAIHSANKRMVSGSAQNSAKIWDLTNGKMLVELQGDIEGARAVAKSQRATQLAELRVKNATTDVAAAKKRKESEEANAKKTAEELAKAKEALTNAQEALKKAQADAKAATDALTAKQKQVADQEQMQKQLQAMESDLKKQIAAAEAAIRQASQQVKQAEAKVQAAQKALAAAEAAAKAKPDDATLAAQVDTAKQAVDAATKELTQQKAVMAAATEKKTSLAKTLAQTAEKLKQAAAALAKAKGEVKPLEAKVKQTKDALAKAEPAAAKAKATVESANRTNERAKQLVARSIEELKQFEETLKQLEAARDETKQQQASTEKQRQEHAPNFVSVCWSPNGSLVAAGTADGRILTYDSESGQALEQFTAAPGQPLRVTFLSDQVLVANSVEGTLVHWQLFAPWQLVKTIGSPDDPAILRDRVTSLAFSFDGKWLATGSGDPSRDGQLKIWDVATGKLVREIPEPHSDMVLDVAFNREGTRLATSGADRFVRVFDARSGEFIRAFEGHTGHVLGVSWSADSRLLASAGADQAAKIWDARAGDQKRTIAGFKKEVTDIHFVGLTTNVLLTAGDPVVQLRRSDNGGNLRTFSGPTDYVYTAAVSADGKLIAAGGHDSVVRIWQDNGKLLISFDQ